MLTIETLYQALLRRDAAYDGLVYVGVNTTGVSCRLTCPARKPRIENCEFFDDPVQAQRQGFRPCKRCVPLESVEPRHRLAAALRTAIVDAPTKPSHEASLARIDVDPSTARRAFKRRFGMTFLQAVRAHRLGRAAIELAGGSQVVAAQEVAG